MQVFGKIYSAQFYGYLTTFITYPEEKKNILKLLENNFFDTTICSFSSKKSVLSALFSFLKKSLLNFLEIVREVFKNMIINITIKFLTFND